MRLRKLLGGLIFLMLTWTACSNDPENMGHSTPIDSTNDNGTAPATWGANDPANVQDTIYKNSSDTGTDVNMGPDNTRDIQPPKER